MTEHDFIDQINSADDWRPHALAYSDWLQERGDPRAFHWEKLVNSGYQPAIERRCLVYKWKWIRKGIWGFRSTTCHGYIVPSHIFVYLKYYSSDRCKDWRRRYATRWEAMSALILAVATAANLDKPRIHYTSRLSRNLEKAEELWEFMTVEDCP